MKQYGDKELEIEKVFSNDPIIYGLYKNFGIPASTKEDDIFNALIKSIISQQLSVQSARAIYGKFIALFEEAPVPDSLLNIEFSLLRSAGLSGQKANYVRNVGEFFKQKELKNRNWESMSDEEIIDDLTKIKGVGVWTVDMLLMFPLDRQDIFPVGDLGIRLGMKAIYGLTEEGRKLEGSLIEIAEKWKPWRTIASKLIWMSKDQ